MKSMLVTCPESGHLEKIEYFISPLGMLVKSCTRFPGCMMDCPRTCAARLDRRHRDEPITDDVLLIGDDTRVIKLVG